MRNLILQEFEMSISDTSHNKVSNVELTLCHVSEKNLEGLPNSELAMVFSKCRFNECSEANSIIIQDCSRVTISDCDILNNRGFGVLI